MQNGNHLTIQGKRFHYAWLRDHCLCPQCFHRDSSQKIYDIGTDPAPAEPQSVDETASELRISWNGAGHHESIFPIDWLLEHSYDPPPEPDPLGQAVLWDAAYLNAHPPGYFDAGSTPFQAWAGQIPVLGFAVVHNLGGDDLHDWIGNVAPMHLTEYGVSCRVRPTLQAKDLALSDAGESLSPHTDGSYRWGERLVQFLYAHLNNASGGDTVLVDGFRVAQDFRLRHPGEFQLLASTRVQFRQRDQQDGYLFTHTTPLLLLDTAGDVEAVCYCPKNLDWQLPFDQVDEYYRAYRLFSRFLNDPQYQHRFRLDQGDCLIFQNFRVLHSRSQYDPASGDRDFETGYVDWSYVAARLEYQRINGSGQLSLTA